jgi:hypothetical protein
VQVFDPKWVDALFRFAEPFQNLLNHFKNQLADIIVTAWYQLKSFSRRQVNSAVARLSDIASLQNESVTITGQFTHFVQGTTLDSMTRSGTEMVDRTMDTVYVRALNSREILDTTADVIMQEIF